MKRRKAKTERRALPARFEPPTVQFPVIKIPQPDGSILLKAGPLVVVTEDITTREAARILGLSQRHIEHQCTVGLFKTAWKPGGRPGSYWRIARAEVLERRAA